MDGENQLEGQPEPQESQAASGSLKSDKIVTHEVQAESEVPADEQYSHKPDNPPDILRRDLKRIKSSVDDSFNRLGKKLNDLLNLDDED